MKHKTPEELIAFEQKVVALWEAGKLPYLLHLSGGNELKLCEIFEYIESDDWVFSTHRSHYHYLLKGGREEKLLEMIRNGRSMFVFDKELRFYTSSILAGCCGIAAGTAMAIQKRGEKRHVWCFLGDGAEDEGHFYEAVRLVHARDLPCTFVIEDNDRSCTVSKKQRWGEYDANDRERWSAYWCVTRYNYKPAWPHAGSGCKHKITFEKRP